MARYVALLRAVNVAGHARIATDELARLFAAAGARDVVSFGHAGSFVFSAPRGAAAVAARVRSAIGRKHGERPLIVLRTAAEFRALAAAEPFAASGATWSDKRYVAFLGRKPRSTTVLPVSSAEEQLTAFALRGRDVLVLSGPKPSGFYGFPNSFVEAVFGIPATTRNWRTVARLAKLL
jgi:uncharacterized protein (DUF1697 family)